MSEAHTGGGACGAIRGTVKSSFRTATLRDAADEMARIHTANPFPGSAPHTTAAIFLDQPSPPDAMNDVRGRQTERLALGVREIYVDYGDGMGRSKFVIPAAKSGTARNMNTIAKLVGLASGA